METLSSKGNTKKYKKGKKQKIKVIGDNIKFSLNNIFHRYKFTRFCDEFALDYVNIYECYAMSH